MNASGESNQTTESMKLDLKNSIHYFRRQQNSVLPSEKYIDKNLKQFQNNL